MRGTFVIAGKDLRNLFFSPLFWVLAGICTIVWSLMFYATVAEFMAQSMSSMAQQGGPAEGMVNLHFTVMARHISLVNLVMIFAIAGLSMRLFTEENRNRTMDLLLTSPVTATEIALGKLIAGTLTAWALIAISALYPISLAFFGKLDWGPLVASYLGLLLLVATYVAVGMFASSLTQSTVLSAIMGLIFNVMLWFIGAAADVTDAPIQKAVFDHLNVGTHFINFIKGTISIAGVVFFASVIGLFTFLTQRVVESARWR